MILTRRGFIGSGAAFCALSLRDGLFAQAANNPKTYSIPVLGDIHFDSPDPKFYHAAYTHSTSERRYKNHLAEHVRNSKMWKEHLPNLIKASAQCARPDSPFVLQMGDFIQGDCGKGDMHRKMLDDAFSYVKGAYGGKKKLIFTVGNHDIRGAMKGDGALAAMKDWMPKQMSKELGTPVTRTTFSFRQGPDVFIAIDFNNPNLDYIKKLLDESSDARYTFVVSHGPVVPSGLTNWILFGKKPFGAQRRELRALLAKRNAIALSGHTHRLEFIDCKFPEGQLTQFVFNSVWNMPTKPTEYVLATTPDQYGKHSNGSKEAKPKIFKTLVGEYAPYVQKYHFAIAAGHYRLDVSDAGVEVLFYDADSLEPAKTFKLR
jgi:hypothetical protein